ncbi:MAG: hypothetical protein KA114_09610 [Bacteroidales bacterium]|nr:hypothetical protein [Bacteroidales bacterium]
MTVLYRHDKDFTAKILDLIKKYCESKRSDIGVIQTGAIICTSLARCTSVYLNEGLKPVPIHT